MIHLGDITKISGSTAPIVDVIIGGSPCQDLSVAGKRAGLAGERSGLFMEQIRIVKEMREHDKQNGRTGVDIRPRYMVWENVCGAFSSNGCEDFRAVLEEIAKVSDESAVIPRPPKNKWKTAGCIMGDGWSIAWRVFDAQFWGVPQRRRRISLVADFGGESAPEILFIRNGLSGHPEQSQAQREATARNTASCARTDDPAGKCYAGNFGLVLRYGNQLEVDKTPTLATSLGDNTMSVIYSVENHPHDSRVDIREDGTVQTLTKQCGTGGNNVPLVMQAYRKQGHPRNADEGQGWEEADKSDTLNVFDNSEQRTPTLVVELDRSSYNQGKNAQFDIGISEDVIAHTLVAKGPGAAAYCIGNGQADQTGLHSVAGALNCMHDQQSVLVAKAVDVRNGIVSDVNGTIQSSACHDLNSNNTVIVDYYVRRLTPMECERLQGFPDHYTDIGEWIDSKGKKHKASDASRYKTLGNSIALPSWKWVLKRISAQYERDATMASLFDGIAGFPYLWEQINGKGSCLWASEIEEFAIAVSTRRINNG